MENKLGVQPIKKLIRTLGIPMIVSMVLQAVYNIVDTAFVVNMPEYGQEGNLALTYAFPVQLVIIALGVGTGVGINSILSKYLGEKNGRSAGKIVGNGIFVSAVIYLFFLLFGIFFSESFISMQGSNAQAIEMGTNYLRICCCLSFGVIGFNLFERLLQSTGKTMYSTIAQIAGAVINIVLDYVFIFPCHLSVEGAAYATVLGQIASFLLAAFFHFRKNRELKFRWSDIKPEGKFLKEIYRIGLPAILMQGLLSVMMLGMNLILGTSEKDAELLQGSFGIYYKIQQMSLFACFGLSNTIITVASYNYGKRNASRVRETVKYGILDTMIVALILTVFFEIFARPIAALFGMASGESSSEITEVCVQAIRIASISYLFMGFNVAVQGCLQAFRKALSPVIISLLRLAVFIFPFAYLFTLSSSPTDFLWWTFPIGEVLTCFFSAAFLRKALKELDVQLPCTMSEERIKTKSPSSGVSKS